MWLINFDKSTEIIILDDNISANNCLVSLMFGLFFQCKKIIYINVYTRYMHV